MYELSTSLNTLSALPLLVKSGSSHDQRPGLPKGIGRTDVMYGVKTIKGKVNVNE